MSPAPRRRTPRAMSDVLAETLSGLAPTDPLSRLQAAWPDIAGRHYAEHSAPSHLRRDGAVAVRCASGSLASELSLQEPQLRELIQATLQLNVELRFEGPAGRH